LAAAFVGGRRGGGEGKSRNPGETLPPPDEKGEKKPTLCFSTEKKKGEKYTVGARSPLQGKGGGEEGGIKVRKKGGSSPVFAWEGEKTPPF